MTESGDTSIAAEGSEELGTTERGPAVLQVLPRLETGGVERGAVEIAGALAEAGWTAIVASEGGPLEHELARSGARHVRLPLASKNPLVMRANVSRLVRLMRSQGVELIHARSRAPAWSAALAARHVRVPLVTTFHATYNAGGLIKRRYNGIMAKGERVIAISHFIADHIEQHYPVDPARIRVIHRGVDLARFDPERVSAERVIALAGRWRLPDGVPVVMLPGRLTRWKGQRLLIEALARVGDLEWVCALVGSDQGRTAYREELEALIDRLGLNGRVFMVGHCDDMPAAYMLADLVVSASTDPEGFGRVVSEAQALGRPVAVSDHGGAPEQLLPEETGFLFRPGDPADLAAAIERALLLTPEARHSLAARAITNVRDYFSKDQMCAGTLGLYREVLNQRAL